MYQQMIYQMLENLQEQPGNEPKLNRLGTKEWEKTKAKVKSNLREVAEELIKLYAKREKSKGFKFSKDGKDQEEFEYEFIYAETDDQLRCTAEIKKDMEDEKPMDRLLCGDVGFGKTEVAMRAAFKAVNDIKQVAYIVPTTVLAKQQANEFRERMKNFPIVIEDISRFKTSKEQRVIIEKLSRGEIDIIIGTHRLLSSDVKFRDLGLLIIDEEHRFGVKDKEKIKIIKDTVDVLTMTATPIPRTMNMSLSGVRDMSVIYEPPYNRLPIKTYIIEKDMEIIREAIYKEVERGGQVFYVYNRVEFIENTVNELKKELPKLEIDYAHGKMTPKQIEKKMKDFVENKTKVLVCTTILESGIDIPNANTIIIEDGDKLRTCTIISNERQSSEDLQDRVMHI